MKKIVVTGALGHIGSALIRQLPDDFPNAEIVLVDNLITQRYCSLFNLPKGRYRFVEADITKADLGPIFKDAIAVVHLAALTDAEGSLSRPGDTHTVNVYGTSHVVEAVECPLIFASTTSVYGPASNPYVESKREAEVLVAKKVGSITLRLGTIFGASPGMRFHTAVNRFCWQAAKGETLTVWATAWNQIRPYCSLFDATTAIRTTIIKGQFDSKIYDVVTDHYKVSDIVAAIRDYVPALVHFVDSPAMNQVSFKATGEPFPMSYRGDLNAGIHETLELLGALH